VKLKATLVSFQTARKYFKSRSSGLWHHTVLW